MSTTLSRREIHKIWANAGPIALETIRLVETFICQKLKLIREDESWNHISKQVAIICYKIREKWNRAKGRSNFFEIKNKEWLDEFETFSVPPKTATKTPGRPPKDFLEASAKTKRRKIEQLKSLASSEELVLAAEMNARREGKEDATKLLHEVMQTTPTRPSKNSVCPARAQGLHTYQELNTR